MSCCPGEVCSRSARGGTLGAGGWRVSSRVGWRRRTAHAGQPAGKRPPTRPLSIRGIRAPMRASETGGSRDIRYRPPTMWPQSPTPCSASDLACCSTHPRHWQIITWPPPTPRSPWPMAPRLLEGLPSSLPVLSSQKLVITRVMTGRRQRHGRPAGLAIRYQGSSQWMWSRVGCQRGR